MDMQLTFSLLRALTKCHFLSEVLLDHLFKIATLSPPTPHPPQTSVLKWFGGSSSSSILHSLYFLYKYVICI